VLQKIFTGLVCLSLLLASLACAASASGTGNRVGNEALDFTLQTIRGQELSLSQFRGQPVLVNFFATWCGPCKSEMPALQAVYERYMPQGLVLLAIDMEESQADVTAFASSMGLSFPILLDSKGNIASQYGARSIPRTFFIDSTGVIRRVSIGAISEKELTSGIDELFKLAEEQAKQAGQPADGIEGCVNIGSALVRSGPSKSSVGVFRLENGECVSFDARSGDSAWLRLSGRVSPQGQRLWASAEFFTLNGDIGGLPVE
jgi:cytochrome c biogenesis protein CcmG, thiol:disulfide interchange protein DsbE